MPRLISTEIPKRNIEACCRELKSRNDVRIEKIRSSYEVFRGKFMGSPIIVYSSGKISHYDNDEVNRLIKRFCRSTEVPLTHNNSEGRKKFLIHSKTIKKKKSKKIAEGRLYSDGSARGNPGPAGFGFVIELPNKQILKGYRYIGIATNNEAEYQGLLAGLGIAHSRNLANLEIFLDSELIVKHLKDEYKIRSPRLAPLYFKVRDLLDTFSQVQISHIKREENKTADFLANLAIDEKNQELNILNE